MVQTKIYTASDHVGFKLKEKLKKYLDNEGYEIKDFGSHKYNKLDDYPDFVIPLAKALSKDKTFKGVIFGKSGQGEAITANKVKGIRAVVYYGGNLNIIKLSRQHNDSNVLSLGAGFLSYQEAVKAVDLWLKTPFSNALRHKRRLGKIEGN
ncbi:RpiB/LacA/LacB family sugar-phosphate isomerase [Candidatus Pacearchaeota archaeon]|nr:RpiB/LacA/LacB family sugar-phosphate isomerase [Candidatus Pacearchaeota archaeon]